MPMEYGDNKVAKALEGKKPAAPAGPAKGLVSAMKAFESATTTADKAEALKSFVMLCQDEYGDES